MKKTAITLSLRDTAKAILAGNKVMLARAITLCESQKLSDRRRAEKLLAQLLPHTGRSWRIGITGSPGVGKSTFIDALGKYLTATKKKIAVLAIDPSSERTKGSILGDKTRMEELSRDELAFIRPSATGSSLGGVAEKTREAILLCEAAGFNIVLVETVGVGQSETAVRNMVDFFLLLQLAGAGDELQGIKKGIMEMADAVVITKADGENEKRTRLTQVEFQQALHLFQSSESGWTPKVLTASSTEKKGIGEVWKLIEEFFLSANSSLHLRKNREQQNLRWFHESVDQQFRNKILHTKKGAEKIQRIEKKIKDGKIIPSVAAAEVVKSLLPRR